MKINMPVTQREVELTNLTTIVSKTDLKGRITFVNRDFLQISGFTEDELLGQNQNIVRHPDMPPAAFEDLWKTIKTGKPWIGIVKNRCKNGDHYWVDACITPMREGGEIIGYISVRRKASLEQIEGAIKFHRAITGRHTFIENATRRTNEFLARLSIKAKLAITFSVVLLSTFGLGFMGLSGVTTEHRITNSLYNGKYSHY